MKAFYSISVLLLLVCGFQSCKKDKSIYTDFNTITVTDENCIYIGDVDPLDWTYDANLTAQEHNFLKYIDSIPSGDSTTGYILVSAACPNPNPGQFTVAVNTEKTCKMHLVCVNSEMQILYYTSRQFTGGPVTTSYDFRALTAFHKNENYRLYYGFYTAKDSLYYQGHGDFRIE
jgi:hypothetical protein